MIRAATARDVSDVLELWKNADAEPSHTDDVASVTQLLTHDPDALLVAEDDGRLVGSIVAGWDGWRGSIYRLVVAHDYRRRGIARRLLLAAEERLADAGAMRLQAIVVETDERAAGFWAATNWERQQERLRFVKG